ncbi:hypothetical protein E4U14_006526 [Claviceps sp. LM454 group G7]|nr:hypothetical protein E4U14_006526 [Claviceps sp. LM454 group G7]
MTDHQEDIRADVFVGLEDALSHDDAVPENLGRPVILPSSFLLGATGTCSSYVRTQDSMAMEAVLDLRPVGVGRERNKKCRRYQVPHNGHGP